MLVVCQLFVSYPHYLLQIPYFPVLKLWHMYMHISSTEWMSQSLLKLKMKVNCMPMVFLYFYNLGQESVRNNYS